MFQLKQCNIISRKAENANEQSGLFSITSTFLPFLPKVCKNCKTIGESKKKRDFSGVISVRKLIDKCLIECSSSGISACASPTGRHCAGDQQQSRFRARKFWVVPSWCRPPRSFGGWWFLRNCLMSLQGCYK